MTLSTLNRNGTEGTISSRKEKWVREHNHHIEGRNVEIYHQIKGERPVGLYHHINGGRGSIKTLRERAGLPETQS